MTDEKKERRPTGPEPDRLRIEGDWEVAVKKSLVKKAPPLPRRKPKHRTK